MGTDFASGSVQWCVPTANYQLNGARRGGNIVIAGGIADITGKIPERIDRYGFP